ncbi:aspartate kinase [Tindallia magadiensis]|uniref:Aspartokinase n=1 Tax=Tindallia magadiensis TaxID=69895 RepID=A0A1I3AWD3_9FIRM|nr:aspartate kinase [Tindallia magadiensis]SFH54418.1 aspartate kinase [Tindallia magadiensis]
MNIVVQKYGGTSVGSPEKIKNVARKVIQKKQEGYQVVVIVSAMGDSTDRLMKLAHEISEYPNSRELDVLLTTGEQVSIALLAMAIWDLGEPAISFTGSQLNIQTTAIHQKARILDMNVDKIHQELSKNKIVVVAGFQGVGKDQEFTTLGRGGSDTSAVALAAKLRASCEIYTDVDGIYTMDPRKLKKAKKIDQITSEEMMEMASLGAGVLHHRSVELAHKYRVPLYVASAFDPVTGTRIISGGSGELEESVVTGMTSSHSDIQVTLMYLPASMKSLRRIFDEMAQKEINVDMISQMKVDKNRMHVSFTVPKEDAHYAKVMMESWKMEDDLIQWEINEDIVKMSIVGLGMRSHSGVAGKVFDLLAQADIEIKMITTSEINLSWVIDAKEEEKAIELIGEGFELTDCHA